MHRTLKAFIQILSEIERHFNQHSHQGDTEGQTRNCSDCINYLGIFKQEIYCLSSSLARAKIKDSKLRELCDVVDSYRVKIIQEDFKHNNQIELIATYKNIIVELKEELSNLNIFKNYGFLSRLKVASNIAGKKFIGLEKDESFAGTRRKLDSSDIQEKASVKNNYQGLNGHRGDKGSVKDYGENFA